MSVVKRTRESSAVRLVTVSRSTKKEEGKMKCDVCQCLVLSIYLSNKSHNLPLWVLRVSSRQQVI